MANVTYLLGAGASCKCLPTYANFGARFMEFQKAIEAGMQDMPPVNKAVAEEIITLCRKTIAEFSFHNTPDTIAKKYFHTWDGGKESLDNLKMILILYFMYEQSMSDSFIGNTPSLKAEKKAQIDKRYDSFIAAILEPKYGQIKISPNFNILTWNYDLQFELCFKNYANVSFYDTQLRLQCIPSNSTLTSEFQFKPNQFSIIHLNGIAYNKLDEERDTPFDQFYTSRKQLVNELIEHYTKMKASEFVLTGKGLLNFAWERDESFPHPKHAVQQIMDSARIVANKTEVLVIIGYSFPVFNRDVDTALFSEMKKLRKIYIQSPIAEDLKNTILDAFIPVNDRIQARYITPVTALESFHIPHEANRKMDDHWVII